MLAEIATRFFMVLTTLFVIVDPIGIIPMFLGLTRDQSTQVLRWTIAKACLVGAGTLILFSLFGNSLFAFLGLNLDAFRVGGGLLLLLTALDAMRGQRNSCRCSQSEMAAGANGHDLSIVPIAIPMLAGPGAMTSVMVFSTDHADGHLLQFAIMTLAIIVTFLASYWILRSSSLWRKLLGDSGISAVQRIMGLILVALSLQLIAEGAVKLVRHMMME